MLVQGQVTELSFDNARHPSVPDCPRAWPGQNHNFHSPFKADEDIRWIDIPMDNVQPVYPDYRVYGAHNRALDTLPRRHKRLALGEWVNLVLGPLQHTA